MSPPSSKAAASVPSITALRQKLDYGDAKLARCSAFYDDIRVFRKKYYTSSGLPGIDLIEWKSPEHQAGLNEMTNAYLEEEGMGVIFWPDDDTSPNRNRLQYSENEREIKQLMKQLIFRLNQQQYRNNKYKKKAHSGSDNLFQRGQSTDDPIDLDAGELFKTLPPKGIPTFSPTLQKSTNSRAPSTKLNDCAFTQSEADRLLRNEEDRLRRDIGSKTNKVVSASSVELDVPRPEDIYDVPQSPEPLHSRSPQIATTPRKESRTKRNLNDTNAADDNYPSKRFKPQHSRLEVPMAESSDKNSLPSIVKKRISPRERKVIHRPEYVSTAQLSDAMESPTPDPVPGVPEHFWLPDSAELARRSAIRARCSTEEESENDLRTNSLSSRPSTSRVQTKTAQIIPPTQSISPVDTNPPNLGKISTPSSMPEVHNGSRHVSEQQEPPVQVPQSKPTIEFVYRVVLSRIPVYQEERWYPKGKFQDKSLRELLQELPFKGNVNGIVFNLEGPGFRVQDKIDYDDENQFELMKRHFNKRIRSCLGTRANASKPLLLEMEIEPRKVDSSTRNDDYDDGDIDW